MWVKFLFPMDWKPLPGLTISYRAGMVRNVTTPCAEMAIRKGKAVRMIRRRKDEQPHVQGEV